MKTLFSLMITLFLLGCSGQGGNASVGGDGNATAGDGVSVHVEGDPSVDVGAL